MILKVLIFIGRCEPRLLFCEKSVCVCFRLISTVVCIVCKCAVCSRTFARTRAIVGGAVVLIDALYKRAAILFFEHVFWRQKARKDGSGVGEKSNGSKKIKQHTVMPVVTECPTLT